MLRGKVKTFVLIIILIVGTTVVFTSVLPHRIGKCPRSNRSYKRFETSNLSKAPSIEKDISLVGISLEEDSQLTPGHPSNLLAKQTSEAILLVWPGTGSDILRYYRLYRKNNDEENWHPVKKWWKVVRVMPIVDDRGTYEFIDRTAKKGVVYQYGVTAVDFYCNESAMTKSTTIKLD